jgi:rRNA maturation RNase YbeY
MPKSPVIRLHHASRIRPIPPAGLRALVLFLMSRARRADAARSWGAVDVIFVGHAGMRPYNAAVFGKDESTDVITLTYAPAPGLPDWNGELIINAELARELGPRYGGAPRELALYLAHGCDHLTGGVDDTPAERRLMRRRETGWIKAAQTAGLLEPLAGFA